MDLRPEIKNHDGLLIVGDVHSNVSLLRKAVNYAKENTLFLVMLGDLVDGMSEPMETIEVAHAVLETRSGALVIGNHDDKFRRYALGNPVVLSYKQQETLINSGNAKEFVKLYSTLIDHCLSDFYHVCGDIVMVHAATHSSLWKLPDTLGDAAKAFALYGSVSGDRDEHGMPIRTYEWIDDIPCGKSAVVGHARDALGKDKTDVTMRSNLNGGTAYFVDTSCGKTKDAPLSGIIAGFSPKCEINGVIKFYEDSGSRE